MPSIRKRRMTHHNESPNHPYCKTCARGFETMLAYAEHEARCPSPAYDVIADTNRRATGRGLSTTVNCSSAQDDRLAPSSPVDVLEDAVPIVVASPDIKPTASATGSSLAGSNSFSSSQASSMTPSDTPAITSSSVPQWSKLDVPDGYVIKTGQSSGSGLSLVFQNGSESYENESNTPGSDTVERDSIAHLSSHAVDGRERSLSPWLGVSRSGSNLVSVPSLLQPRPSRMSTHGPFPQPIETPPQTTGGKIDTASVPPGPFYCRSCLSDLVDPVTTMCGHLFCRSCIVQEIATRMCCPVCQKMFLVRLHI
ncbi:hypothetical protein C8Q80DRAFT_1173133 [Daedaleopsis nitida]|nr:hypothetical protein C8Q80DRAFT_1173133 [Daedaleopsis nitida]